ncbi:WSC-domain-containing protein [Tuber magnatum]|uniref:WSC-domain-containing protein n=1 Tax=Tuber magnatum TaxID=42249 RepID=A0A317SLA3_9PEZI|nr:WSC-domain-containing protein [Tuber magnatum]
MDPSIVGSPQFGIMWRKKLRGNYRGWTEQIFAQALVYTPDDTQFVYVASQMNMVYKIDAKTGDILISRNLAIPFLVSELDDCNDISFVVGSTATGVIDDKTNTWYMTTKTYRDQSDVEKGRMNGRYLIHALDTRTLEEKPGYPVNIEGLIARNNPIRMFQGGIHHQRPALMQSGPYIYAGFASHCVQYNFTGWIIGWNGQTGEIVEMFATEGGPEDTKGGGVWMSGGGLAQDSPDSLPRYASQLSTIPVPGRQPPTALEEAAVHMAINSDGSLGVIDFSLDGADKDLGTSGIALLDPTVFKTPTVARIGCIAGKSGKLYFLNLDDLGGYQMGPNKKDAVLQTTELLNSVFATAGSYPLEGGYVYVNVVQHPTVVFKFSVGPNGEPVFTQVAQSNENTAFVLGVGHGTSTSLNGQPGTGLYWVTDIQGLNLRIYKAVPENGVLVLLKGLNIPAQIKFSRPTFGNARAYLTTSDGHLIAVGSPVNPPMSCSSPIEFGNATIGGAVVTKTLNCTANIAVTVTGIGPRMAQHFSVSDLPTLPLALTAGQIVSFKATFKPTAPGPLSDDIYVNTTNSIANYADNTPIAVRGVAISLVPVLFISPNTVSFAGIITGENPDGYNRAVIIENRGSTELVVAEINVSTTGEAGPFFPPGTTSAGPFTFTGFPTTVPPESSVTVNINFNPTTDGNFGAYVRFKTNGGTKFLTVVATSGSYPKALIEFEKIDGSGWTAYQPGVPFSFGTVFQQTTRTLSMRLTNFGNAYTDAFKISARNGIDLGEGTELAAGQSATAQLFCSVPKSQVNVDAYVANSTWTMNTNDPTMGKQDIMFVCNAISEQLGPLKANSQGRYRYIGCFKENNPGRQLSNQLYGADDNENGKCMSGCAGTTQNFIFAGTQYHRECWCGNTIPTLKVGEEDCNFDCSGNGTQICGGNGYFGGGSYISLFADSDRYNPGGPVSSSTTTGDPTGSPTPTPTGGPIDNPGNSNFGFSGCYTEATTGRALSVLTASDTMTVNTCLGVCSAYEYAGLEYGSECWCGNTLASGAAPAPLTECRMKCAGNATEYCGAGQRLSLYKRKDLSSSSSLSATSSTSTSSGSSTTSSTSTSGTPMPTGPTINPGNANYTYLACYTEATTGRALSGKFLAADDMTVPKCLEACAGFRYAGLEYRRECFCGDTFSAGAVVAPSSQCGLTCMGYVFNYCGGGSRLTVYEKRNQTESISSSSSSGLSGAVLAAAGAPAPTSSDSSSASTSMTTTSALGSASSTSNSSSNSTSGSSISSTSAPGGSSTSSVNTTGTSSETDPRALNGGRLISGSMTVTKCQAFCIDRNLTLSGLEAGNECYCGTALQSHSTLGFTGCNTACSGNSSQTCGGSSRLSVYNYTLTEPPVVAHVAAVETYITQGCYTDDALSGFSFTNSTGMTVELCVGACRERNSTYAGLEFGEQCHCGTTVASSASRLSNAECDVPCKGNVHEYCGAGNKLSLYRDQPSNITTAGLPALVDDITE